MNEKQIWDVVLSDLELSLSKANFKTWFSNTHVAQIKDNGQTIIVGVPTNFSKNWLEKKYHRFILEALQEATDDKVKKVIYSVETVDSEKSDKSTTVDLEKITIQTIPKSNGYGLNPRYTFNNFIVGKGTELAYAACVAVTKQAGKKYNPLFIYGGVGLGKTHLLQAIGQEVLSKNSKLKIVYTTCEEFTNELVASIQTKTTASFRNKFRNSDVLMVDDVQFLSGRESTQEEVFHTFNVLLSAGKQVVLSCDRPPSAIKKLAERLQSRFEGGIIADIGKPETDLREAILLQKCKTQNTILSTEIIQMLAREFPNSVRDLEGGLIRLITYAKLTNRKFSLGLVKEVVQISSKQKTTRATPKSVLDASSKYFTLTPTEIRSSSRRSRVVKARQFTMYILRSDLGLTLDSIAKLLNKSDHTSVIYSVNKVENEIKKSSEAREILGEIRDLAFT